MQNVINVLVFMLVLGSINCSKVGFKIKSWAFIASSTNLSISRNLIFPFQKGKETEYEIRALPIGGFVSMAGEADQEEVEEMKDVPLERISKHFISHLICTI